ncbi:hypothetical protein [Neobacillus niacini]|uniref:hypothetical protein n=1 Tax=Neobacillus niacini TaxID=86668 RepID=UPI0021CB1C20|nr:hypothetical protein [Neobacillus niacini]MCM3767827.1 hypothetical protein [Neobacillus niacini]
MANKLFLNQKDRTLLLISEITKDYDWFYQLLRENKRVTEELIEELPKKQKDFIQDILPLVKQNATNEWKESTQPMLDSGENREKWLKCRLCNTPTRYIHYIVNRKTRETINVGSECVKEYAFNDKDINESRREAIEIRRLILLNESVKGINKIVENWKIDLEKYPVLIPSNLANKYLNIGLELSDLFDHFIKGKFKENTVERILHLVEKGKLEKEKFEVYINNQENNLFLAFK